MNFKIYNANHVLFLGICGLSCLARTRIFLRHKSGNLSITIKAIKFKVSPNLIDPFPPVGKHYKCWIRSAHVKDAYFLDFEIKNPIKHLTLSI